jgi:hypothetical protein
VNKTIQAARLTPFHCPSLCRTNGARRAAGRSTSTTAAHGSQQSIDGLDRSSLPDLRLHVREAQRIRFPEKMSLPRGLPRCSEPVSQVCSRARRPCPPPLAVSERPERAVGKQHEQQIADMHGVSATGRARHAASPHTRTPTRASPAQMLGSAFEYERSNDDTLQHGLAYLVAALRRRSAAHTPAQWPPLAAPARARFSPPVCHRLPIHHAAVYARGAYRARRTDSQLHCERSRCSSSAFRVEMNARHPLTRPRR